MTSVDGAKPGGRATVTAQTTPGVACAIVYRTPAGTLSLPRAWLPRLRMPMGG